jgi:hypothetical protein
MTVKLHYLGPTDHVDPRIFFDINSQDYTFVDSDDADIIVYLSEIVSGNQFDTSELLSVPKIFLSLDIFENYENQFVGIMSKISKVQNLYSITNAYDPTKCHPRILFNDFLFNRVKAYYSKYQFSTKNVWCNNSESSYILPTHPDPQFKKKIYVAPNNTFQHTINKRKYRARLSSLLKTQYCNQGYIGDVGETSSKFLLYPHYTMPDCNDISQLENLTQFVNIKGDPPHNEYYRNTFISIYGETVEYGNSIVVTEKTYDPLIKGHFILPFSTNGFISHLKRLGFRFPGFIDYSYDSIADDNARYDCYESEVQRLLNLDIDTWRQHWVDNANAIKHNQSIFWNKPYNKIDLYSLPYWKNKI